MTRRRVRRPVVLMVAAVLVGGLVAVGCGDDGGGGGGAYEPPKGPATESIEIEAGNFFFDPDTITAEPGVAKLTLQGTGGIHTLVFDDGKYPGFQLEVSGDESDSSKIELKAGRYTFYCDIPAHRASGMEGELTVE